MQHNYRDAPNISLSRFERMADTGLKRSTAKKYFDKFFDGWNNYCAICNRGDRKKLLTILAEINGDDFRQLENLDPSLSETRSDQEQLMADYLHDRGAFE